MSYIRQPLLRLLAINLVIGIGAAVLMVGVLLAINPLNLRHLLFSDRHTAEVLGFLLFGFLITFGSASVGSALMKLGREPKGDAAVQRVRAAAGDAAVRHLRLVAGADLR